MKGIKRRDMWGDYLILAVLDWRWFRPRHGEGEDYRRLLEHLWRSLFKDGIIPNIQQCLSALCKESYPRPPPSTGTLSLTSLAPPPSPVSNEAANELSPKSSEVGEMWRDDRPALSPTWCVCFLRGCAVRGERFPPQPQAPCHVPRQQSRSYGPVGFNGAGEALAAPDKKIICNSF